MMSRYFPKPQIRTVESTLFSQIDPDCPSSKSIFTHNILTVWQMWVSLASPLAMVWGMFANLASLAYFQKKQLWRLQLLSKKGNFLASTPICKIRTGVAIAYLFIKFIRLMFSFDQFLPLQKLIKT